MRLLRHDHGPQQERCALAYSLWRSDGHEEDGNLQQGGPLQRQVRAVGRGTAWGFETAEPGVRPVGAVFQAELRPADQVQGLGNRSWAPYYVQPHALRLAG